MRTGCIWHAYEQTRRAGTGLLVVATTTALTAGALSTGVAHGAPSVATAAPQADKAALAVAEATQEEKVNANPRAGDRHRQHLAVLRETATSSSRSSTTPTPRRFPLVKDAALQSYRDGDSAATRVHPHRHLRPAQRDRDNWARAKVERDLAQAQAVGRTR